MRDLVFGLFGGAALLMYGVDMMGNGLERSARNTMKSILQALTGSIYRAILVSTVMTALVQSSTAITVLTVGFVNAGLMTLTQAVGVIYGANIGTTVTAQLMAFKLTDFALLFVGIGFAVQLSSKNDRTKHLGSALMGFGLMFTGLKILNSGVPFLKENQAFRNALLVCSQTPLLAVFIGMLATMLVHSSAATVALTMVLARGGLINLTGAVCLMLGDNIGTCVTAQMASINTNVNARRTAWAHSLYNVIGVVIVLLVLPWFVRITGSTSPDISRQIANSHTVFNILSAVAFLPFTRRYVRFLERVVPGKQASHKTHLDELLLDTPAAALAAVRAELGVLSHNLNVMLGQALGLIGSFEERELAHFDESEREMNESHKEITKYLMEVSRRPLSESESTLGSLLLQAGNLVERMGDHFGEVTQLAVRKQEEKADFSAHALNDMGRLRSALQSLIGDLPATFTGEAVEYAGRIAEARPLAQILRRNHMDRLQGGKCTVDAGVIYFDIISHCESIIDHIESIASWLGSPQGRSA